MRGTGPYLSNADIECLRIEARERRERATCGLYEKYLVVRTDGKEVGRVFVLEPEKDIAARPALHAYATVARLQGKSQLARDLEDWLAAMGWEEVK